MAPPSRPIVHIGMAKAASTFLQLEVFPKLEGLHNLGKHHVSEDLSTARMALTRLTSADWDLSRHRIPFEAALDEAARVNLRPVLSDEDLSVFKFLDPETMARRLRAILGPYDVLFIIRDPISWVRSHYLFRLEHQNPLAAMGFESWLRFHMAQRRIGSDTVEIWYSVLARTYREMSGGAVHILPYELMKTDRQRFGSELSGVLGTEKDQLLALLAASPRALAHKLQITALHQEFYELFRWIILEQPARAERCVRDYLGHHAVQPLDDADDARLRSLGAAEAVDAKAWARVFRALAQTLPQDGPLAVPAIPQDIGQQLAKIAGQQTKILHRDFGFDLSAYDISY